MSDARIRRGGTARIAPGKSKARVGAGQTRGRALKRQSWFDRVLEALPVSDATVQRIATWAIVGIVVAMAAGIAAFLGVPGMVRQEAAQLAMRAGFEVQKVEVRGVERMDEMPVYNIALGQVDRSMLALDLPKVRAEMLQLGWVKDARISRRLPDTLVVDIVERRPTAIWQYQHRLALIDQNGVVIAPVNVATMPDLPVVIGPGANSQVTALGTLMEKAPSLKPMLAGASWVGGRRWDLRFQSGEVLALPAGDDLAGQALVDFAKRDSTYRLLGQGFARFDMRVPGRIVVRVSKEPGRSITDDATAVDLKSI
jgi:cell division protein FtsQ